MKMVELERKVSAATPGKDSREMAEDGMVVGRT